MDPAPIDRRHFLATCAAGLAAAALPEVRAVAGGELDKAEGDAVHWSDLCPVPNFFPVTYEVTDLAGRILAAGTLQARRQADGSILCADVPEILARANAGTLASVKWEQAAAIKHVGERKNF